MATVHNPGTYIQLRSVADQLVEAEWPNGIIDHLIWFSSETQEPKISSKGVIHPLLSKGQFDAIVDGSFSEPFSDTYVTLFEAIIGADPGPFGAPRTIVSIFVREMSDTDALTIASSANVQRIIGKDADTTTVPVDITCNKDDVTFEELGFSSKTLTIGSGVTNDTLRNLLLTGTGAVSFGTTSTSVVEGLRADSCTGIPVTIAGVASLAIRSALFTDNTGAACIDMTASPIDLSISRILIDVDGGAENTDYAIRTGSTKMANRLLLSDSNIRFGAKGGVNIGVQRGRIVNNVFQGTAVLDSGKRAVRLFSTAATDINTIFGFNTVALTGSGDTLFECASSDARAKGLVLVGNTFKNGIVLGSQGAMWIGNDMSSITINFQSKTGIVVMGGSMEGATLQNIPADIVFRNVKGQDDRGDYLPVDGAVDLGSDAKRFADLFLSGNADIEGNATIGGDLHVLDGQGAVIGHTSQVDFGAIPEFQVLGTGTADSSMGFARFEDNASGPDVRFLKSRGATLGANVIVQDGDTLGRFRFQGADGGDFNTTAAEILGKVDGSPSLNDIPGAIVFRTRTAAGALSDKLLITEAGDILPATDDTHSLGSTSKKWKNLFIDDTATIDKLSLGITATLGVASDLTPDIDSLRDLGVSARRFAEAYIDALEVTDTVNVTGTVDIVHTASENDEHALEIDVIAGGFDDIKAIDIQYTTGALAAGEDDEAVLVQIDEDAANGGRVTAFEALGTTSGSAKLEALFAGAGVAPVEQLSGIFIDPDLAEVEGVDKLTDLTNPATNVDIFAANTDVMIIGNTDKFQELEYILSTGASGAGIKPKFEFSIAGPGWTEFGPTDGTNAMRNTGIIAWEDTDISDLGTWAQISGNYLIRITRERAVLTTEPVCSFLQLAVTIEYSWDKDGDVSINDLAVGGTFASAKSTLTIDSNDEVTVPTTAWVYLSPASGSTDNLDGIGAGTEGQIVYLTPTAGKDITLIHDGTVTAGKKLKISGGVNILLAEDHDMAIAIYDATATVWNVMALGASHTAASHSDQGATGAELETLTDTSDASGLHGHGNYVDSAFYLPSSHVNAAQANTGVVSFVTMDDTEKLHFAFTLNASWVATSSIRLYMYPDATETITADFDCSSIAGGEAASANQTTSANETFGATATTLNKWNITSLVPTGAADDLVLIRIDSDTDAMKVIGLSIIYVRSQAQ